MKWSILDSDINEQDSSGVSGFINRLEQEFRQDGPPLEGFRFLNSAMEMLRFTREIEDEVLANPNEANLYVGFQTAEKLDFEAKRYRRIKGAGVKVIGFGTGFPETKTSDLLDQWNSLPYDTKALENQWYLVSSHPTPIAFVGWETSEERFGVGGLSTPGKEFRGFVSNDTRIVNAIIAHLVGIKLEAFGHKVPVQQFVDEIDIPLKKILTLTDKDDNPEMQNLRQATSRLAKEHSAELVLYDLSAASTLALVSAYPEENREEWLRVLSREDLSSFGRGFLTEQLAGLEKDAIKAGAILPEKTGYAHLSEWAAKEDADLIVIPESMTKPGLIDRLKGYTMEALLESASVPVVVYEKTGLMRLAQQNTIRNYKEDFAASRKLTKVAAS